MEGKLRSFQAPLFASWICDCCLELVLQFDAFRQHFRRLVPARTGSIWI